MDTFQKKLGETTNQDNGQLEAKRKIKKKDFLYLFIKPPFKKAFQILNKNIPGMEFCFIKDDLSLSLTTQQYQPEQSINHDKLGQV